MKRLVLFSALAGALAMHAAGCRTHAAGAATSPTASPQGDRDATGERLAELAGKLDSIDRRLQAIEAILRDSTEGADEPDPDAVYSVPIDGFPFEGPDDARVTLVKAYEFACPYCEQVRPALAALRAAYPRTLKVVYRPFIVHPDVAVVPAMAACAAHNQGKFHEMMSLIWDKAFRDTDLSHNKMASLAKQLSLDMTRFYRDATGEACLTKLQTSRDGLVALGVRGTPTFYINGRYLSGAQPVEVFEQLIDEELAKADAAIAGGIAAKDYYRKAVVEAGRRLP